MKNSENTATADPKSKEKLQQPKMFNVIVLNDDFTPTDFVVQLMIQVFQKSMMEAVHIMAETHNSEKAMVGTYPKDIAETKVAQALYVCKESGHPLRLVVEKAD